MIKNILILNMTRMGDLVQSTSSIAGLRKQYPNACITLMVTSAFEEFSKKIPCINKRVVFDINHFVALSLLHISEHPRGLVIAYACF